jgi:molybdopterin synthase catalytic subunit/molybdopterin converting factor small subunit
MGEASEIRVRIVYHAAARELAGTREENATVRTGGQRCDVRMFKVWLATHRPRLAPYLARMRVAQNEELVDEATLITDGDELSLLPPVAGGARLAEVRATPLSIDEVVTAVQHPGAGGIAIFLGVVRDQHEGKAVSRLDYEAYAELAHKEMARILDELERTHPSARVAALHRVGELAIGDAAVVVAASAAHRDEAFTVCRAAIDRIKASVPIWKKEWAADGSALWVNLERDERT